MQLALGYNLTKYQSWASAAATNLPLLKRPKAILTDHGLISRSRGVGRTSVTMPFWTSCLWSSQMLGFFWTSCSSHGQQQHHAAADLHDLVAALQRGVRVRRVELRGQGAVADAGDLHAARVVISRPDFMSPGDKRKAALYAIHRVKKWYIIYSTKRQKTHATGEDGAD